MFLIVYKWSQSGSEILILDFLIDHIFVNVVGDFGRRRVNYMVFDLIYHLIIGNILSYLFILLVVIAFFHHLCRLNTLCFSS